MLATLALALTAYLGIPQQVVAAPIVPVVEESSKETSREAPRFVPFYSQFTDVSDPAWRKLSCGIASLAMVLEYHTGEKQSVDSLLSEGRQTGAYESKNGWIHEGLISLAEKRGLHGTAYNLHASSTAIAFRTFTEKVAEAPVIVSVQYNFKRSNPISHLIVVHRIENDIVYYNDPATEKGGSTIAVKEFLSAWNKRFIILQS